MTEKPTREKKPTPSELEQSIIARGKKLLKEEPDKWPGFLNNFHMQVIPEKSRWRTRREQARSLGYWDKKNKDTTTDNPAVHSNLWLNQTPKEFFETIDKVIAELDTDGKIVEAINNFCNIKRYEEKDKTLDELDEKLIPVFARLVVMGYTMQELRG
jgi:hypothetical protein